MNRAGPVAMRKALEIVESYKQAGIIFVPVPVLNGADHQRLLKLADSQLEKMLKQCEEEDKADQIT